MKKYLLVVLAALGFAACTEDNGGTNFPQNGEMEESYIAINLMSTDIDTRATTPDNVYEYGTDAERKINTAFFFFFDENGNPFNVTGTSEGATAPSNVKNHLQLTIDNTSSGDETPNISDIKKAVLVLNTYKGVYPSKIVAILNWTPENKAYSLSDLHEVIDGTLGNSTNGFVMSNSVYKDGAGNMVDAVPITLANIKATADEAKANPVEIYVERTAAKVIVTAIGKNTLDDGSILFDTEQEPSLLMPSSVTPSVRVYVNIKGWELYNDYKTTNLLKNIDVANWDDAGNYLGLVWNNAPYYRCYWASSQNVVPDDSFYWSYNDDSKAAKGFKTNYGFKVATAQGYEDDATYTYCAENTNGESLRTKVILKGQLMQEGDAPGTYKALELARWYGNEYAGNDALRTAVAKSLSYTLFYKYVESGVERYISVDPNDIECVKGSLTGDEAYEVGFQLSAQGKAKEWYLKNSVQGYVRLADPAVDGAMVAATNAYLADNVEPALLYANGMTYYIVDIKHLGAPESLAEYGVVRNHVYQIAINSIKGYGSPIYSGLDFVVESPEYPEEDEASYVAARINVLSWKVVTQSVDIVK